MFCVKDVSVSLIWRAQNNPYLCLQLCLSGGLFLLLKIANIRSINRGTSNIITAHRVVSLLIKKSKGCWKWIVKRKYLMKNGVAAGHLHSYVGRPKTAGLCWQPQSHTTHYLPFLQAKNHHSQLQLYTKLFTLLCQWCTQAI